MSLFIANNFVFFLFLLISLLIFIYCLVSSFSFVDNLYSLFGLHTIKTCFIFYFIPFTFLCEWQRLQVISNILNSGSREVTPCSKSAISSQKNQDVELGDLVQEYTL